MINIRNSSNKFGIVYKKTQSARNIMNYNKKDDELNLPIEELPQKNTVKDMVLKIEKKKLANLTYLLLFLILLSLLIFCLPVIIASFLFGCQYTNTVH